MGRKYPKKWVIITATQTTQEMGHYYWIFGRVEVTIKTNGLKQTCTMVVITLESRVQMTQCSGKMTTMTVAIIQLPTL